MTRLLVLAFLLFSVSVYAQFNPQYGPHDLDSLFRKSQKATLIFLDADWCKICSMMKNSTFSSVEVKDALKKKVNFIEFNAEFPEDVVVDNRTFTFLPVGSSGKHQLALEFGMIQGQLELPVVVILNTKEEIIFQNSGFMDEKEMLSVLNSIE